MHSTFPTSKFAFLRSNCTFASRRFTLPISRLVGDTVMSVESADCNSYLRNRESIS